MIQLLLTIIGSAFTVLEGYISGSAGKDISLAEKLVEIIQAALAAYYMHTGQPIDPTLVKPLSPLP